MPVKSVTVSGSAVKQVTCEKCQCEYAYEMFGQNTRRSDGFVHAGAAGGLLGVAIAAAVSAAAGGNSEQKLRSQAQANLERSLSKGCEPVPCPGCGWYQANMVRESRKRYRKPLLGLGATLLTLGAAGMLILVVMDNSPPRPNTVSPIAYAVAVVVMGLGAGALAWRWSQQRAYDINGGYPSPRPPYPGSPQGFDIKKLPAASAGGPGHASEAPSRPPPAPAAGADWYYTQGDGHAGPVTWIVLKDLAAKGALGPQDMVFATGSSDWVEASTVPGLLPDGQVPL